MEIGNFFLGIALVSVLWGVLSSIIITAFVAERGTKINYFLYRLYIVKYVSQYMQITKAENGKPGPWFYSFVIAMNVTLLCAIIGLILKSL